VYIAERLEMTDNGTIRTFETGATRDTAEGKLDYEGFLSPEVLCRYAQYLDKHRIQSDGTLRESDNWQKGIARSVYLKSLLRHLMDVWLLHRGCSAFAEREDAVCAVIFNAMGYLFELLKERPNDKN